MAHGTTPHAGCSTNLPDSKQRLDGIPSPGSANASPDSACSRAEKTFGAIGPCMEPFGLLAFFPKKPCGQRKAFGRRLAQCPEGYNICFAVVEMLKGHQRKGKSKKAPSVRPQPTHATPLVTQCRPPINLSRAAFRACLGVVLSAEADSLLPHADRTPPRNAVICDLSRWLSLVSACAAESTWEDAEPV